MTFRILLVQLKDMLGVYNKISLSLIGLTIAKTIILLLNLINLLYLKQFNTVQRGLRILPPIKYYPVLLNLLPLNIF